MAYVKALELTNPDNTQMLALTKNTFKFYVRSTPQQPWDGVVVDQAFAKQALRLLSETKKDAALRAKLEVRAGAVDNLILVANPAATPMNVMTARLVFC